MEIYRIKGIDLDGYVTRCDEMFSNLKLAKQCFIDCVKAGRCYNVTLTKLGDVDGRIVVTEILNEGSEESYTLVEFKGEHGKDFIHKYFDGENVFYTYQWFTGRWCDSKDFDTYEEAFAAANGLPIVKQYEEEW